MGHIQDRWYKAVNDPATGKAIRVKTNLCGTGLRYKVRYLDPDGNEKSKMYPDRCKKQAEAFLLEVESSKREGKYVDPRAGRIKFRAQAENWIKGQSPDGVTREVLRSRLTSQIYPYFGDLPVNSIKTATVRDWLGVLDEKKLSQNYKTVLFTTLSSIMDSAVEDKLITINPCGGKSIKRPTSPSSNIVVWPEERLRAIQGGLPDRFRIVCAVGAGCGLRQGEILGLSLDDTDEDGTTLHVQRQIRVVGRTLVFAPPKSGKKRRVPLSPGVLAATRAHERAFPSTEVTLPWGEPGGDPVTVRLLLTGSGGRVYTGDLFHKVVWQGAFRAAGLKYRKRADGMHALRHFYASTLLAQGVSIKELAEYLGHSDPGFTLRTYTHLVPSSYERARLAIDGVFGLTSADGLDAA
ncbi:MAG: site-specific integrase [Pseudonocardiales bacterium]|nr:site-specific integrase [Pseudonocardiales bacterium]MBV9031986.1 site-specific integrase [Pseudonocardiales bacterium]MBW0009094.1 site-specific integrase [Pseudonocardiales bacterium]